MYNYLELFDGPSNSMHKRECDSKYTHGLELYRRLTGSNRPSTSKRRAPWYSSRKAVRLILYSPYWFSLVVRYPAQRRCAGLSGATEQSNEVSRNQDQAVASVSGEIGSIRCLLSGRCIAREGWQEKTRSWSGRAVVPQWGPLIPYYGQYTLHWICAYPIDVQNRASEQQWSSVKDLPWDGQW